MDKSDAQKLMAVRRRLFSEDERNDQLCPDGNEEEKEEPVTISWESDSGSGFSDM